MPAGERAFADVLVVQSQRRELLDQLVEYGDYMDGLRADHVEHHLQPLASNRLVIEAAVPVGVAGRPTTAVPPN